MASSINASTTAGVVTTADTSGVLNLQTAGTTAISIDASQAVSVAGTLSATGLATLASSQITGATFPASGSGLELVFQSGTSKLQSFNRTGSAYLPLTMDGTTVGVLSSGATIGAFSSTGLAVTGTLSATGVATFSAGTAALPAITTTGDTNTGIFFSAADTINFSTGGADKGRFSSNANGVFTVGTQSSVGSLGTDYGTIGAWGSAGGGYRIYRGTSAGTPIANFYADSTGVFLYGSEAVPLVFSTNATEKMSISSAGVVTITRAGGSSLTAIGVYNETVGTANVSIGSDGRFTRATSSLKYKKNVLDAPYGLSDVLALRPVTYEGKNPVEEGITYGGLIAEEVDAIGLSQFVEYADDGTPDAVRYGNMVSLAFKAIQEQQALITQLQADVAALKGA